MIHIKGKSIVLLLSKQLCTILLREISTSLVKEERCWNKGTCRGRSELWIHWKWKESTGRSEVFASLIPLVVGTFFPLVAVKFTFAKAVDAISFKSWCICKHYWCCFLPSLTTLSNLTLDIISLLLPCMLSCAYIPVKDVNSPLLLIPALLPCTSLPFSLLLQLLLLISTFHWG